MLVNREYEKTIGLSRDRIIGKHLSKILGNKTYVSVRSHVEKALSGEPGCFDKMFFVPEKGLRHDDVHFVPAAGASSQISGFYTLIIDQTEKKRL